MVDKVGSTFLLFFLLVVVTFEVSYLYRCKRIIVLSSRLLRKKKKKIVDLLVKVLGINALSLRTCRSDGVRFFFFLLRVIAFNVHKGILKEWNAIL